MDFRERIQKIQLDAQKAKDAKARAAEIAECEKAALYGNARKIHEVIVNTIEPVLRAAQHHSIYRLDVTVRSDQRIEITKRAPVNAQANEAAIWRVPEDAEHNARLEYVGDPDKVGITRTFAVVGPPMEKTKLVIDAFTEKSVMDDVEKFFAMIASAE
jgi:hypothetical protein